jgi:hypothetical protein
MPGLRPGYRLDRPDRNLSVYVEQVNHNWNYPGALTTSISFSRGQPMSATDTLAYAPPSTDDPTNTERQNLGKVFKTSEFTQKGKKVRLDIPGTFTGKKGVGRQLDTKPRSEEPKRGISFPESKDGNKE